MRILVFQTRADNAKRPLQLKNCSRCSKSPVSRFEVLGVGKGTLERLKTLTEALSVSERVFDVD